MITVKQTDLVRIEIIGVGAITQTGSEWMRDRDAREERDKLLAAIKKHHEQKADDRCWMDDNELYVSAGLPMHDDSIGCKAAMLKNCERFVTLRMQSKEDGWKSYAELEAEVVKLKTALGFAVRDCEAHNSDYQFVTPDEAIAVWKELIK